MQAELSWGEAALGRVAARLPSLPAAGKSQ